MKSIKTIILLFCMSAMAIGQMNVTEATTNATSNPATLIENVLLGEGVEILSITHQGEPAAVGVFDNGNSSINMNAGIIMSTGKTSDIPQVGSEFAETQLNTAFADSDLEKLAETILPPGQTATVLRDLNVVTIEFIPTTDTLKFRYIWASEEYPEFNCSIYNDIFGFIISGPGYAGPYENGGVNIATIPGTDLPVSINTINNGTLGSDGGLLINCTEPQGSLDFSNLYVDNLESSKQPVFDGFTVGLNAVAAVEPCQTYRIKMMIADVGDARYDSAIFLEAGSFRTEALSSTVTTTSVDNTIVEGCTAASVTFTNARALDTDFDVNVEVGGTATSGVDYTALDPADFIIPAGQLSTTVTIEGIQDNIAEGTEYISIAYNQSNCKRDTIYLSIRDYLLEEPSLPMDTIICAGNSVELDATSPTSFPEPQVFTNETALDIAPTNVTVYSPISVSGLSLRTLTQGTLPTICFNVEHKWLDDLEIFLQSPEGKLIELTTDNGGGGDNYTNTCFTVTATTPITDPGSSAPYTGSWLPEGDLTGIIGENPNGTWQLVLTDDSNSFNGKLLNWSITFPAIYDIKYDWTSQNVDCQDCPKNTVTPSETTIYKVQLTDSYGCQLEDSIRVVPIDSLDAPVVSCGTATESSVSFVWDAVSSANGYEVNVGGAGWMSPSPGPLTHTVTGLAINTEVEISVRAISDCGAKTATISCQSSDCTPASLSVGTVTMASCNDASDGSVNIAAVGGTPPYTFTLGSETNSTGNFSNLAAGNYTIQMTDALSCGNSVQVEITAPAAISSAISITQALSCHDDNNAAISLQVDGGTAPYMIAWSNSMSSENISNLSAGTYKVTITDNNNCVKEDSITITVPDELVATLTSSNLQCAGANDGTATASATGGTEPYTYEWSANANAANTATVSDLAPGVYSVTVTDANNCTAVAQSEVMDVSAMSISTSGTNPTCAAPNSGQATATVQGGTEPYTYAWNDSANTTTATATNLPAGQYIVSVRDANNCEIKDTIVLTNPAPFTLESSSTNNNCADDTNGTISLTVSNASNPTYLWSNGMTTANLSSLATGEYCVTVTDDMGCTNTACETITAPEALSYTEDIKVAGCQGQSNGSIALTIAGGMEPYQIQWQGNASNSFTIEQLAAGTYSATITDANGCTLAYSATVQEDVPFTAELVGSNLSCNGASDGSININISNSVGTLTYQWTGPNAFASDMQNITNLAAGEYNVSIQDAATGCQKQDVISITEPDGMSVQSTASNVICHGDKTGSIALAVSGGNPAYMYSVDGGNNFGSDANFTNLAADTFYLVVRDANNCETKDTVILTQPDEPVTVTADPQHKIKFGESVTLTATTNVVTELIANIAWSPEEHLSCTDCLETVAKPEQSLTYVVQVTDQQGCSGTASISVVVDRKPSVHVANIFSPNGDSVNDYLTIVTDNVIVKSIDRFEIYDRWGSQVFLQKDIAPDGSFQGWDGTFHGDRVSPNVYVWVAQITLIDGTVQMYGGDVTVVK